MKKYLLPEGGSFYKANLHAHSTESDGNHTPAELKALYQAQGYSVLALTDHEVFLPHNELSDESFLFLNGFETGAWQTMPGQIKNFEAGMIALDKDIVNHPLWHRSKYAGTGVKPGNRARVKFDESLPDFERSFNPECVSKMMKTGRDQGFFVIYNHPRGCCLEYPDYINHFHMHAMEMYNYDSIAAGIFEYNPHIYDSMLRSGKRIYCVYTDDVHDVKDGFHGWVMIKADRLDYPTIAKALVEGNFYSSMGPEINAIWYEDGAVHITFPRAERIVMLSATRRMMLLCAPNGDPDGWREAVFPLDGTEGFVRFTLFDENRKTADTNAYFLDEIDPSLGK